MHQNTAHIVQNTYGIYTDIYKPTPWIRSSSFNGAKLHFFPNMQLYHLQRIHKQSVLQIQDQLKMATTRNNYLDQNLQEQ